jgi:hypothetical protein
MKLLLEKKSSQKVLRFKELTNDLIKYTSKGESEKVWENKEGEWIMSQDEKGAENEIIYVRQQIWHSFQEEFEMNYEEIQEFLKKRLWLDKKIKVRIVYSQYFKIFNSLDIIEII